MELDFDLTLSGNDASVQNPSNEMQKDPAQEGIIQEETQQQPVESYVDTLQVTVQLYGEEQQDYTEMLGSISGNSIDISSKLDRIIELLEQQHTVSENDVPEETVSENTVSENTISENALIYTRLEDYGLTDSLLLITDLLLFVVLLLLIFKKGGRR